MKYVIHLLLICFSVSIAYAQKPEPIIGFAKVHKPLEWYKTQRDLWQRETVKDSKNAYAWYNYYRATRTITKLDRADSTPHTVKQAAIKRILDDMEREVPNTFEYNHAKWISGGNDFSMLSFLEKAHKMDPDRPEMFDDMVNWGEVTGDFSKRDEYLGKWFRSGEMSPGFLNYNYNVIAGLKPGAILLTTGDNDTYPIWMLQAVHGFRKDVTVLNASLIYIPEYRAMLFKKLGITDLSYDISKDMEGKWDEVQKRHRADLLKAIVSNKPQHPVYIALTVDKDAYTFAADKLYLIGLAYEYRNSSFDNMAVMKRNFEQHYALDYLDRNFVVDRSEYIIKRANCNYVVPMLKLHEHYRLAGEEQKAERIRERVMHIVKGSEQEKDILEYFKSN